MNKLLLISSMLFLLFLMLFIFSCGKIAEPINYGHDECEYCRMLITDNKYGTELITEKGKVYKFDSIECLINYALVENLIGNNEVRMLVSDFANPGNFADARRAFYLHNDEYRSPMGLNVMAFGEESKLNVFESENDGSQLSWMEVVELTKQKNN